MPLCTYHVPGWHSVVPPLARCSKAALPASDGFPAPITTSILLLVLHASVLLLGLHVFVLHASILLLLLLPPATGCVGSRKTIGPQVRGASIVLGGRRWRGRGRLGHHVVETTEILVLRVHIWLLLLLLLRPPGTTMLLRGDLKPGGGRLLLLLLVVVRGHMTRLPRGPYLILVLPGVTVSRMLLLLLVR